MLVAMPHSIENSTNRNTELIKVRTSPKRRASQPVSGCMIALASAYELIVQVPSLGLTPRLPAMCGTDTLTMVMSSTSMKVLKATAMVSRSEEHTSELQSLMRISYAVFCLKKKKKKISMIHTQVKLNILKQTDST